MCGKNRYDLTPLLADARIFGEVVRGLAAPFGEARVTKVAALDALGFAFGGGVAQLLGAGLVLVRKGGKVAWEVEAVSFNDYSGERKSLEVAVDAVREGDRVLIVDDWSETGTQLRAAVKLIERLRGEVVGASLINVDDAVSGDPFLAVYPLHSLLSNPHV